MDFILRSRYNCHHSWQPSLNKLSAKYRAILPFALIILNAASVAPGMRRSSRDNDVISYDPVALSTGTFPRTLDAEFPRRQRGCES